MHSLLIRLSKILFILIIAKYKKWYWLKCILKSHYYIVSLDVGKQNGSKSVFGNGSYIVHYAKHLSPDILSRKNPYSKMFTAFKDSF